MGASRDVKKGCGCATEPQKVATRTRKKVNFKSPDKNNLLK
jgi:hypothetical protein